MKLRLHAILLILIVFAPRAGIAQGPGTPPPTIGRSVRPILTAIEFQGNSAVSDGELEGRIQSRATSASILNTFARRVYPISERIALFLRMKAREEQELRYLNRAVIEEDKAAILALYDERGYHQAQVRVGYGIDTAGNTAVIRFEIREGERASIWGVRFTGIESLPPDIRSRIVEAPHLRPGSAFDVANVDLEVRRDLDILRNSGYAFASELRGPEVPMCPPERCGTPKDSIIIHLFPGNRYRFAGTRVFHDTVSGKQLVNEGLIRDQMEYKPGEWFSWRKVDETRRNLYRLGVFEQVSIDTLSPVRGDSLAIRIGYRLRDQNEIELSAEAGIAPRADETVVTVGPAVRYTRLNFLGRGIRASVGARMQARVAHFLDSVAFLDLDEVEFGIDGRMDIPSPPIPLADVASLTAAYARAVEDRAAAARLVSNRISFGIELGMSLPSYTFINGITARILYQINRYHGVENFIRAKANELVDEVVHDTCQAEVRDNLDDIVETLARTIYRIQVLQGDSPDLAPSQRAAEENEKLGRTFILGGSLLGDHRNDYFSPTDGYLVEGRLDVGLTGGFIGGFVRGEFDFRNFNPVGARNTIATRVHLGAIGQFGGFPLTPIGSRFHAGGAHSIRGWGAREMLVTSPPEELGDECSAPVFEAILEDSRRLLGGLMLLELSAEYRKRFDDTWVGMVFIDAGNAYFQNYNQDKDLVSVGTIVENIGVATGVNVGFETPAGPVRFGVGIPIWNPIDFKPGRQAIWQHPLVLKHFAVQFSIGHAF